MSVDRHLLNIQVDARAVRRTRPHEYLLRFVFGGLITAIAGLIAMWKGPVLAGLFLAFPAILPAQATLIEKHEIQRKHRAGLHGTMRGRTIASIDAIGASMGSLGLIAFGAITWKMLPHFPAWLVLAVASIAWFSVAFTAWWLRKKLW